MREHLDRPKQSYLSIFFARATRETTPELPLVSAELLLLYNAATLHPFLMPKGFKLCTAINLSIYLSIYIYIHSIYTCFISHALSAIDPMTFTGSRWISKSQQKVPTPNMST